MFINKYIIYNILYITYICTWVYKVINLLTLYHK